MQLLLNVDVHHTWGRPSLSVNWSQNGVGSMIAVQVPDRALEVVRYLAHELPAGTTGGPIWNASCKPMLIFGRGFPGISL